MFMRRVGHVYSMGRNNHRTVCDARGDLCKPCLIFGITILSVMTILFVKGAKIYADETINRKQLYRAQNIVRW